MSRPACLALALCVFASAITTASSAWCADPQLAHMVFFQVTDQEDAAETLVAACKKHLSGHEGTIYFSAGLRAKQLEREVNERDFDVALHVVFKNRAAHDKYQAHPRHLQFIAENKKLWTAVRVFDSLISQP